MFRMRWNRRLMSGTVGSPSFGLNGTVILSGFALFDNPWKNAFSAALLGLSGSCANALSLSSSMSGGPKMMKKCAERMPSMMIRYSGAMIHPKTAIPVRRLTVDAAPNPSFRGSLRTLSAQPQKFGMDSHFVTQMTTDFRNFAMPPPRCVPCDQQLKR